ncbi:helix-turn-helix domain-containing protein [Actinoplanes sp. RD1]|uniref:helix-turn-helix domain-containing protein n=1 Tax=Actinoplanes sp. RD1 TaxID=3064538 RepID=UPI0027425C12|nr:helix-turn-helix transcriptional regulator [Actinoplanes sp. RD1]
MSRPPQDAQVAHVAQATQDTRTVRGLRPAGGGRGGPAPAGPRTPSPARALLGIELRALRQRLGLSQRRVVRMLGLRAHSNLADYESGRRVPPNDILVACEKIFQVPQGHLGTIRARILRDEADRQKEEALRLLRQSAR